MSLLNFLIERYILIVIIPLETVVKFKSGFPEPKDLKTKLLPTIKLRFKNKNGKHEARKLVMRQAKELFLP